MVAVLISASTQRSAALSLAGQSPPDFITLRLLVDTGASLTCIDAAALQPLGLTPTGVVPIHTPSTGDQAQMRLQYDVSVFFYHAANSRLFGNTPVIASDFSGQNIDGLLGRDILSSCLLVYDGTAGIFSLAF